MIKINSKIGIINKLNINGLVKSKKINKTIMDKTLQKQKTKTVKENILENNKINEGYANKILNDILQEAVENKVSDIHIDPYDGEIAVKFRIEGDLTKMKSLPIDVYQYLISIIKLKTSMDITEKKLPQDGRLDMRIGEELIDIRAATIPTIYGEKIALRLLNRNNFIKDKRELGFSKEAIIKINNIMNKGPGILLVTGSTGSGKTTTVYSLLNTLRKEHKNIVTIEDPVEYKMKDINQIQVNSKIGLNFENGLKSILRQDPDIIMVGEIRDVETAKMAIRAAITGHLVISTMHTNDTVSSIDRLIDMNIPTYLISSSIQGIISQRLIKKVCLNCEESTSNKSLFMKNTNNKCMQCDESTLSDRTMIYEVLEINDDIKHAIKINKQGKELKEICIKNEMITFEESIRVHRDKESLVIGEALNAN